MSASEEVLKVPEAPKYWEATTMPDPYPQGSLENEGLSETLYNARVGFSAVLGFVVAVAIITNFRNKNP